MAITPGVCESFRLEVGLGVHDLLADDIRIALYLSSADLSPATTVYTDSGEVASGPSTGYTAGGRSLTGKSWALSPNEGDDQVRLAMFSAADPVWPDPTSITARGALLYNASKGNRAIAVISFGMDITSSEAEFAVRFPPAARATALLRI